MISHLRDKAYIYSLLIALVFSLAAFLIFHQYLVKSLAFWSAPQFIPIYYFAIVIFVLNAILSLVILKKERTISLAFNFSTVFVNFLLLISFYLNLRNPNA